MGVGERKAADGSPYQGILLLVPDPDAVCKLINNLRDQSQSRDAPSNYNATSIPMIALVSKSSNLYT